MNNFCKIGVRLFNRNTKLIHQTRNINKIISNATNTSIKYDKILLISKNFIYINTFILSLGTLSYIIIDPNNFKYIIQHNGYNKTLKDCYELGFGIILIVAIGPTLVALKILSSIFSG